MRFDAVIFDLFGTLVTGFAATLFRRSLDAMADAVGADRKRFTTAWIGDTHYDRTVGTHETIEANVRRICEMEGIVPTDEGLVRAARARLDFTRALLTPRRDAVATLSAIRDAGLRTALVSDCSAEVPELWDATPFAALIDLPIFSCSARMKKPDPRIFMLACDGLGVAPDRCLYVGDGGSNELTGASAVGMQAVMIAPFDDDVPANAAGERQEWDGMKVEGMAGLLPIIGIGG